MFNCMRALVLASVVLLAACGEKSGPAEPPQNFSVTPGDGQVVAHFTQQPGLTYWLFLAQGSSGINRGNYLSAPGARVVWPVSDGGIISGLENGQTYSFFMNASDGNGPAGPETPTVTATPRLAGSTWTANLPIGSGADTNGIAYGLNEFLAVSRDGNTYFSTDGKNWAATTSSPGLGPLNGVGFNSSSSMFLVVGDNGVIASSTDAATWTARTSNTTARLNDAASTGGSYVAVGDGGTILGTSDYTSWVARSSGVTANLHRVQYLAATAYVAVGDGGSIVTSPDGFTWTVRNSGTTADLYDVTYGNGVYMAVGANGTILTSTDLGTWTAQAPVTGNKLYGVTYGSQFMIVGQGGLVLYGTDGVNWTAPTSAVAADLYRVIYSLGEYLAIGAGGINQYAL